MDWVIRYSAVSSGDLPQERLVDLDADLTSVSGILPGRIVREAGKQDGILFAGSLAPVGRNTHEDVQALLDFLDNIERKYNGLSVRVEDNLKLVRRDPVSGQLGIDLDGGALMRVVPGSHDLGFPDELAVDDSVIVQELQYMIDALTGPPGEDDPVYSGGDPTIAPFADTLTVFHAAPEERVEADVQAMPGPWRIESVEVVRRHDTRSGVEGFYVSGELHLDGDQRAHLVAVDLVLRDAAGRVISTEECFAGYDVRRATELEAEAMVCVTRADEVASIDVAADAYIREIAVLATGRPDGGTLLQPRPDVGLQVGVGHTRWPDVGWTAAGELTNDSGQFLATVALTLSVADADGAVISDDECDVTMIAPSDSRPFDLIALLHAGDKPETATLRGRFVTRRRQVVCRIVL